MHGEVKGRRRVKRKNDGEVANFGVTDGRVWKRRLRLRRAREEVCGDGANEVEMEGWMRLAMVGLSGWWQW